MGKNTTFCIEKIVLTKDEARKREFWVQFLITNCLLNCLYLWVSALVSHEDGNYLVVKTCVWMLAEVFSSWLIYHLAYKKYGIRYLTFLLWASPIYLGTKWAKILRADENFLINVAFFVLVLVLYASWWYLSFELRRNNEKMLILKECKKNVVAREE